MVRCKVCGSTTEEHAEMFEHVLTEHPEQFQMAFEVALLEIRGPQCLEAP